MNMDLKWILFMMTTIATMECSIKLKGNMTVTCHIEQSLVNSHYKLHLGLMSESTNSSYYISYCKCKGQPYKCMKPTGCDWKKVPCEHQTQVGNDRCSSFVISPVSFWSYGDKYIIRVFDKSNHSGNESEHFVMKRKLFLHHCFLDHRPELEFRDGDLQYSMDVSWYFKPYDHSLTIGTPGVMTLFSYSMGRLLSVVGCKSERPCFGYMNPCKCTVQDLVPCQTYQICVRTNIFDGRGLDESKIKTCKNYTVPHGVIPRIGTIEMRLDTVKGVTRFSWIDSGTRKNGTWFYRTQVGFDRNDSSVILNETEKTALELKLPAGTEKCSFSVAKCIYCNCGRTVKRYFKNCALYEVEPKLAEQTGPGNNDNTRRAAFIIGYASVGLVVVIVIGIIIVCAKTHLQRPPEVNDNQDLPVLEDILPRDENYGYTNPNVTQPYETWPGA